MEDKILKGITYDNEPKINSKYGGFRFDDIKCYNISLVTEVANYFKKYGHYPYPPPKPKDKADKFYFERFKDSSVYPEYRKFWDKELERRKNGVIIYGALQSDGSLQKIKITGKQYGYLNYAQILLTKVGAKLPETNELSNLAISTGESEVSFPEFRVGNFYYFNAVEIAREIGRNICVDKTRQVGYSYLNGWIIADEFDLVPDSKCLVSAYQDEFLTKEGTMNKVRDYIDFINKYTDWKKELKEGGGKDIEVMETGYRYNGDSSWYGMNSMVQTSSFFHSTRGIRGKKWRIALFEEGGAFPNIKEVIRVGKASFYAGKTKTGIWILFGTGGGEKDLDWKPFEDIFYNPELFECLPFVNIWDSGMEHNVCGYFHPRYLDLEPYIDENGNTDYVKSKQAVEDERKYIEATADTTADLSRHIAEFPIAPKESFTRGRENMFSSETLIEHYNRVKHDENYKFGRHGFLLYRGNSGSKYRFVTNEELPYEERREPILEYPPKSKMTLDGCMTIWFDPYVDSRTGKIPDNMYYALVDAFGVDTKKEAMEAISSLGACYIYEAVNSFTPARGDRLVAKYVGRPKEVETFNTNAFMLAEYFGVGNRNFWFENDGATGTVVVRDAKKHKKELLLNVEPEFEYNDALKGKTGRIYGVSIGKVYERMNFALLGLKEWLYSERGVDENGVILLNLHLIYDTRLLEELMKFNRVSNFDCISALRILSFLKAERNYKDITVKTQLVRSKNSFFNPEYIND